MENVSVGLLEEDFLFHSLKQACMDGVFPADEESRGMRRKGRKSVCEDNGFNGPVHVLKGSPNLNLPVESLNLLLKESNESFWVYLDSSASSCHIKLTWIIETSPSN
ncbi:hypothetical protein ATANTOWER_017239 [Ataeniobius toweri]|uniref:Uncharacterized protein n=1 Tax=Ataeniobius toweri TaxID=208326 RepID=A0ABU7AFX3_9TELE|nr:hypothetical protein [Ataeniobius toweri]